MKRILPVRLNEHGVFIGFLVLCVIVTIAEPRFLTGKNILNLLRQASIIGIIAAGMTGVIISGNFDISVGAIASVAGAIVMKLLSLSLPFPLALLGALSAGALAGLFSGTAIAIFSIPSLIATMGTTAILTGTVLLITGGYPISGTFPLFDYLGNGYLCGIPAPVIIFLLTVLLVYVILTYTVFGRHVYSVGGNEEASRLSGIRSEWVKIKIFMMNGLCAALAGCVLASRLSTATPIAGQGYDMDAIASVVIGGTSILGGEGSVIKTIVGVLFMSVINNAFNLLGVDVYFQFIVKGFIIVIAVGADSYNRKKSLKN